MNKNGDIISQSEAAKIAGVSRQAICLMKNKHVGFFTDDGKVNASHPDWLTYLEERRTKSNSGSAMKSATAKSGAKSGKNNPQTNDNRQRGDDVGKQKRGQGEIQKASGWSREHSLTGGFDPAQFVPTNTSQLKALTDIVARNLEMRIKLEELVSREVLDSYIDIISGCMQLFVDLPRTVSSPICHKLDRMGMEKDVEKIIGPEVKKIIEQIVKACNDAKK